MMLKGSKAECNHRIGFLKMICGKVRQWLTVVSGGFLFFRELSVMQ